MRRAIAAVLLGLLAAACGGDPSAQPDPTTSQPESSTSLRRCSEVGLPTASADSYRDTPRYVGNEMPVDEVRVWASAKPGFVGIWIDREHNGWVAVSFSEQAAERQAELADEFPDDGVVVVPVDWTAQSLADVESEISRALTGEVELLGTSAQVERGVVEIYLDVLTDESLETVTNLVDVSRVCVSGLEPDDLVPQGPQPQAGDGWRLLLDADETGMIYEVGIAWDHASLDDLLAHHLVTSDVDLDVDFENEVALFFGAVHGSSCPNLRLDDVVVDGDAVFPVIVNTDNAMACTDDAIGHLYVVGMERDRLPEPPFTVHLYQPDPTRGFDPGAIVVSADLRAPGSAAGPDDVIPMPERSDAGAATSGEIIEVGYPWQYRFDLPCGFESLGELNFYDWVADEPIPTAWSETAGDDEYVIVEVLLHEGPEPTIDVTYSGETVTYVVGDPVC